MNTKRVDTLLAYILLEAQKSDDFGERSLGPIHFIKYVYLADLAYAETHNGEIFTNVHWQFFHYGPWDRNLWLHIEPSLSSAGVQAIRFPSDYSSKDVVRWGNISLEKIQVVSSLLSAELQGVITKLVRKFANNTPELLNYVYNTPPMLKAAPKEYLDFSPSGWKLDDTDKIFSRGKQLELTHREKKKVDTWKKKSSEILRAKIAEKIAQNKCQKHSVESIYDDVYLEGIAFLNSDTSSPIHEGTVEVSIDDAVWKSRARYDPE